MRGGAPYLVSGLLRIISPRKPPYQWDVPCHDVHNLIMGEPNERRKHIRGGRYKRRKHIRGGSIKEEGGI